MKDLVKELKQFFTDNLTAYSYLFFAQISVAAAKVYYKLGISNPHKVLPNQFLVLSLLVAYIIPIVFIIAGSVTFDYSSVKDARKTFISLNFFIVTIIIYTALFS